MELATCGYGPQQHDSRRLHGNPELASADGVQNVLTPCTAKRPKVLDVGGSHVKRRSTGYRRRRAIICDGAKTSAPMREGVQRLTRAFHSGFNSPGYQGDAAGGAIRREAHHQALGRDGLRRRPLPDSRSSSVAT